jgi:hypothetical protein
VNPTNANALRQRARARSNNQDIGEYPLRDFPSSANGRADVAEALPRKTVREILREISPANLHRCLGDAQAGIDAQLRGIIEQISRQKDVAWPEFPDALIAHGRAFIAEGERLRTAGYRCKPKRPPA